ncbi:hypothetical protein MAR_028972 [Mya arenaria]|uniref:OTU domain-containing protein n=1 Tax=Mya arenaria TaxID=6604 RepID=A0ABY7DF59_MYAAR|nr:hypothetical protein MAR_028972 [Mya arenaria]
MLGKGMTKSYPGEMYNTSLYKQLPVKVLLKQNILGKMALVCICASCDNAFHRVYEDVSVTDYSKWKNIDLGYICTTCRTVDGKRFDFFDGFLRLQLAAQNGSFENLRKAVDRELMFRQKLQMPSTLVDRYPRVDNSAAMVLDNYVDDIRGTPHKTSGDGDCLFNAVSILLKNDESLSVYLRYHTCIGLVLEMNFFKNHPLARLIRDHSGSYTSACLDSAKLGSASSAWAVLSLADAIERPIRVIYPHVNGRDDHPHISLNRVFETETGRDHPPLYILWHGYGSIPVPGQYTIVNHFSEVSGVSPKEDQFIPVPEPERVGKQKASTPVHISDTSLSSLDMSAVKEDCAPKSTTWRMPKRKPISRKDIK